MKFPKRKLVRPEYEIEVKGIQGMAVLIKALPKIAFKRKKITWEINGKKIGKTTIYTIPKLKIKMVKEITPNGHKDNETNQQSD